MIFQLYPEKFNNFSQNYKYPRKSGVVNPCIKLDRTYFETILHFMQYFIIFFTETRQNYIHKLQNYIVYNG